MTRSESVKPTDSMVSWLSSSRPKISDLRQVVGSLKALGARVSHVEKTRIAPVTLSRRAVKAIIGHRNLRFLPATARRRLTVRNSFSGLALELLNGRAADSRSKTSSNGQHQRLELSRSV